MVHIVLLFVALGLLVIALGLLSVERARRKRAQEEAARLQNQSDAASMPVASRRARRRRARMGASGQNRSKRGTRSARGER